MSERWCVFAFRSQTDADEWLRALPKEAKTLSRQSMYAALVNQPGERAVEFIESDMRHARQNPDRHSAPLIEENTE